MGSIPLKKGYCVACNDGILKPCIGKREKAKCVNHYNSQKRAESAPIAKKSDKQLELDKEYFRLREIFLKSIGYRCQIRRPGCKHHADQIHHSRGRGIYYLVVKYFTGTCLPCHQWAEANPEEAKAINVSGDRLTVHHD